MRVRHALALLLAVLAGAMVGQTASNQLANPLLSASKPPQQQPLLSALLDAEESMSNCKPTGQIVDARCDYETVEKDVNSNSFFELLSSLIKEKYFRFYKVDLYKDCPFWNDNSLCMSRDCTVSKVDELQIPVEYRTACLSSLKTTDEAEVLPHRNEGSGRSVHSHHSSTNVPGASPLDSGSDTCQCAETDFCHWEDEEWSPESLWVDLIDNPERFTGYAGASAHKIWRTIYEENCFGVARPVSASSRQPVAGREMQLESSLQGSKRAAEALSSLLNSQTPLVDSDSPSTEQCLEKRVFYKIISGLHASISIHVCHEYLDQQTGEWKPNLQCFVERIAQHPERLQNVYFSHAVLTRALAKLAERIGMTPTRAGRRKKSGKDVGDLSRLAPGLPPSSANASLGMLLQQALDSPPTFDEASMFDKSDPESEILRREFRDRFRNVSRIMDCVGCDKCRLWGKLQVNGLGTALKILFEGSHLNEDRFLQRSELVALINTVHRVSESIRAVEAFRDMHQRQTATASPDGTRGSNGTAGERHTASTSSLSQSLAERLLGRAKGIVERGRSACESQWERCLSWFLSIVDRPHPSGQKSEL